jgi:hypothetical protein
MSAAHRAMRRLTILVARCRQLAELYAFGDHVGAIAPTNKTNITNNTRLDRGSARRKLMGSASVAAVVLDS